MNLSKFSVNKKFLAAVVAVGMIFTLTTAVGPAQAAKTTLVVGSTQGIPQLNPITRTFAYDETLYGVLWSALTKWNQNGTVGPDLATSWKMNTTGTQWTFNLRAGAKFSDGSAMDGNAVKAVIDYVLDPKTVTQERNNVKMVTKVTATGNKVVFDLSTPNALLPVALAGIKMIKVS
jgi:peptide/nickel transport system substrate-binding protein